MAKINPASRILNKVQHETHINIKSNTPYVSAVKRVCKTLDKFDLNPTNQHNKHRQGEYKHVKYIKLKGMGKAILNTISIGLHFQAHKGYNIEVYTGTAEVLDRVAVVGSEAIETKDGGTEQQSELRKRSVSCVEVKIWLKRR